MAVRILSAALFLVAAAVWPAAVAAQPPPGSAVSQYVEVIPSASGGTVPSAAPRSSSSARAVVLAPVARKALARQPAAQAKVLRNVATSPSLGAPQTKLSQHAGAQAEAAPSGSLPSPAAVADSGGSELPILLAVLLGTLAAVGGWAIYRRTSA